MIVSFIPDKAKDKLYPALKDFCLRCFDLFLLFQRKWYLALKHTSQ